MKMLIGVSIKCRKKKIVINKSNRTLCHQALLLSDISPRKKEVKKRKTEQVLVLLKC